MWAFSLTQSQLTIGFYGLVHSYPVIYFVSLGLLTAASFILWIDRQEHVLLLCLQISLFIIFLWLTPVLISVNPVSTVWTYSIYFPNSDAITQTGHIDPEFWMMQNWPLGFILESTIMKILNVNTADFMAFFSPLLMQFIILLPLYLFFNNNIQNANHRWAACWIFYLANWTAQLYFSPQGLGIFLMVTLLALVTSLPFWKRGSASFGCHVGALLLMAGLAVVHFLTSVAVFLSLAVWWLFHRLDTANLLVLAGAFVVIWSFYGATAQMDFNLPRYVERAFRLDLIFSFAGVVSLDKASNSYIAVAFARYLFSGIFAIVAICGFIISKNSKNKSDSIVLPLVIPAFFVLFSMAYGNEFWMRAFLFSLIPIAYFGIKMLVHKFSSVILFTLILLALPLGLIAHYGSASVDYRPIGENAYWHFMVDNSVPSNIFGGTRIFYPGYSHLKYYPEEVNWRNSRFLPESSMNQSPDYVHIGHVDIKNYEFNLDDVSSVTENHELLETSPYYDLIYNNPYVSLYGKQ